MNENVDAMREMGKRVQRRRLSAGKSVRGLAAEANVDASWLSRLERGLIGTPEPRTLYRLAQALGVEVISLYEQAGYGDGLPGFSPYLRAKYDLPEAAIVQLRTHFELINERYKGEKRSHQP